MSQIAVPLTKECIAPIGLPSTLAIVMGNEAVGVSPEFLAAADLRVYLPIVGFAGEITILSLVMSIHAIVTSAMIHRRTR